MTQCKCGNVLEVMDRFCKKCNVSRKSIIEDSIENYMITKIDKHGKFKFFNVNEKEFNKWFEKSKLNKDGLRVVYEN